MPDDPTCPNCGNAEEKGRIGVEYDHSHPDHYDGISEWHCLDCGTRWGRWSGRILKDGELEGVRGGESRAKNESNRAASPPNPRKDT